VVVALKRDLITAVHCIAASAYLSDCSRGSVHPSSELLQC
jgi:hypothetical protein